jgi:hypothetical protein
MVTAGRGDPVEPAAPLPGLLDPPADDLALVLEAIELCIEGRDVKGQTAPGSLVDQLGDLVTVARPVFDDREDQLRKGTGIHICVRSIYGRADRSKITLSADVMNLLTCVPPLRRGSSPSRSRSGGAHGGLVPRSRSLGAHGLTCRVAAVRGRSPARGGLRLAGEGRPRRGAPSLALQRALHGARASRRRSFPRAIRGARRRRGAALGAGLRARGRFAELHARTTRLREPDRDRLLRRSRAVLALANVMDLLTHELAGLSRRRLSFTLVLTSPPQRFFFRHLKTSRLFGGKAGADSPRRPTMETNILCGS